MNKTLLESQEGLIYFTSPSTKHDFHYIKRCIALSPKPSNIAMVFESTV